MTTLMEHFLSRLRKQALSHPQQQILLDHHGTVSYTYQSLIQQIGSIDKMLTSLDIHEGDKVAICGRNCANWAATFMSVLARQSVVVSILSDFTEEGVIELVRHSEAKAFFVGSGVWKNLQEAGFTPEKIFAENEVLQVIVSFDGFTVLASRSEVAEQAVDETFEIAEVTAAWPTEASNDLCLINYTSGTTSSPKGVMLTSLSLSANVEQAMTLLSENPEGKHTIAILPMAHMYGLATEVLAELVLGVCVHVLTKAPTPAVLVEALNSVHPFMLCCVPLVLEKVFRQKVIPLLNKPHMRALMAIPGLNIPIKRKVRETILNTMGGKIEFFVIGGAALSQEVEKYMKKVGIPYVVGYGMTECGPLIAVSPAGTFPSYSCGRHVEGMEIRIDSENPTEIDGEIQVKGTNVMLGYFKNEEATKAAFTKDGWMQTGDLGILDADGNLYIRGRSKNMILGPSGQNIYPEELEDKVNGIAGVVESVVVERDGHLVALVFPDAIYQRRLGKEKLESLITRRLRHINHHLPKYSQIKSFEFVEKEFEKTPKRSIKRFLYK